MTWSGYAFDPKRNIQVTNVNNLVAVARLIPREKYNDRNSRTEDGDYGDQTAAPYGLYRRFIQSPSDLPCGAPPWGMLIALDMAEGKIRWQVPLGSMQDFGGSHAQQIPPGSISLGGPIVTAGGVVFIAGATDCVLRGFDVETGKELWKASLPACGNATPMTYRLSATGKQYLVIAAGGHPKITEEKLGDSLVAFTLP
jgi:quinoprotein glucose dehydrogenase